MKNIQQINTFIMTREDKELLLKDLCARLPYGVIVETTWKEKYCNETCNGTVGKLRGSQLEFFTEGEYSDIKPYLRPMSSMTEDEKSTCAMFFNEEGLLNTSVGTYIDWLLENHLDYNGLIKMGLALEAPEGMYDNQTK